MHTIVGSYRIISFSHIEEIIINDCECISQVGIVDVNIWLSWAIP